MITQRNYLITENQVDFVETQTPTYWSYSYIFWHYLRIISYDFDLQLQNNYESLWIQNLQIKIIYKLYIVLSI